MCQGARLYVAASGKLSAGRLPAAAEAWGVYPDDVPRRAGAAGASRTALAPFLALRDLGPTSFKWAFVGTRNADTAFFADAAARAVEGLDPDVPSLLTGETPCLRSGTSAYCDSQSHARGTKMQCKSVQGVYVLIIRGRAPFLVRRLCLVRARAPQSGSARLRAVRLGRERLRAWLPHARRLPLPSGRAVRRRRRQRLPNCAWGVQHSQVWCGVCTHASITQHACQLALHLQ